MSLTQNSGINEGGIQMGVKASIDHDARRFEQDWKAHKGEHVCL